MTDLHSDLPALPGHADLRGRTAVFFHAHPDDEAIFTGATIRRLADRGARVVLVTATDGDEGPGSFRRAGTARRRARELAGACAALGVDRLVRLGLRDSGMWGSAANRHPRAFVNAPVLGVARRLAEICDQENAETLVHYDSDGIYGHPDHVAVHRAGTAAAALTGLAAYEATVDREHLRFTETHLVERADPHRAPRVGRVTAEITTAVAAGPGELAAKRAAMAAHASQIGPGELAAPGFAATYGLEWYVRTGPAGLLEALGNVHAIR